MASPVRNVAKRILNFQHSPVYRLPKNNNFLSPNSNVKRSLSCAKCLEFDDKSAVKTFNKYDSFLVPDIISPSKSSLLDNSDSTPNTKKLFKINPNSPTRNILGKGTFGTVVKSSYKGSNYAVKIINIFNRYRKSTLQRELNALKLKHENIAEVFKVEWNKDVCIILLEDCSHCDNLENLLNDSTFYVDKCKRIRLSLDICHGLQFCHKKGILHLDIKPKNVLVASCGLAKLCDFGASANIRVEHQLKNYDQGTVSYMAPELFQNATPTEKSDVYSLSVTMWQIEQRKTPYHGINRESIIYNVVKFELRPEITLKFDHEFHNLYSLCWAALPTVRPDVSSIILYLKNMNSFNRSN